MKAIYIVREGAADRAFEIREVAKPEPQASQIRIAVEAFGLNFADVMARKGMYRDRPPLPCVVGYDVVGRIDAIGSEVDNLKEGQRVAAMTRFGGYAEFAVTEALAATPIPDDMDPGVGTALGAQYCTAWYAAEELTRIYPGDHVLVHAAAGGVGTALVQLAKRRGAIIFGTAGSAEKIEYIRKEGVDHPINYRAQDWEAEVRKVVGDRGLDIIFDSIGADYFKKGKKLLGAGGRIVGYGAAKMSGATNIFSRLRMGLAFGIYHPAQFLMDSQCMIGVNMLRMADHRPEVVARCLKAVAELSASGELQPRVGARFPAEEIAKAHRYMEERSSVGKIVMSW